MEVSESELLGFGAICGATCTNVASTQRLLTVSRVRLLCPLRVATRPIISNGRVMPGTIPAQGHRGTSCPTGVICDKSARERRYRRFDGGGAGVRPGIDLASRALTPTDRIEFAKHRSPRRRVSTLPPIPTVYIRIQNSSMTQNGNVAAPVVPVESTPLGQHAREVAAGGRFEFGANWTRFLALLDDDRIRRAENSLRTMLGLQRLDGLRFLDVGSGSGLFSLAARRMGATVHSFDFDPQSVACTSELKRRYFPDDSEWRIEEGSALDERYVDSLGRFDVVYSWGVLHHTGEMWRALANVIRPVTPGGLLFIAIYNDMGAESVRWRAIKRRYCSLPTLLRVPYAVGAMLPYEIRDFGRSLFAGHPRSYLHSWTRYRGNRGMSRWRDIIDWVGGYPYEVASADELIAFYCEQGFSVARVESTRGLGCNELVLRRGGVPA